MQRMLFLVLAFLAVPAHAVYKCQEGGQIVYRDQPCRDGGTLKLQADDPAAAAEARQRAVREKQELQRLENERRKEETAAAQKRAGLARAEQTHQNRCRRLALHKKWGDEDVAAAALKQQEKAKRKARRKAEQYELECG